MPVFGFPTKSLYVFGAAQVHQQAHLAESMAGWGSRS